MSKKIYLAGPWVDREAIVNIAKELESEGHTLTHPWWNYEGKGEEFETRDFMRHCAVKDFRGVVDADVVVVYNTVKSEGKATEQGIAIAFEKPIVCWTPVDAKPSTNIFHHMYNYRHVDTFEGVLEAIRNV